MHMALGIEGLALLRLWPDGDREQVQSRIADVARFVEGWDSAEPGAVGDVEEVDSRAGYDAKAAIYDDAPNPVIAAEQRAVWPILDRVAPGCALDAACGTGRHAARLLDCGHTVVAVDAAPRMLETVRAKLPQAEVRAGDLTALPVDDDSIDLAVCALALTHLAVLEHAIAELARVVRPGGQIVLSDVHPQFVGLGGNAYEVVVDGRRRFIRNHVHPHSSYIAAFIANGLVLRGCHEPTFDEAAIKLVVPPWLTTEAVAAALLGLPAILAWDLQAT